MNIQGPESEKGGEKNHKKGVRLILELYEKLREDLIDLKVIAPRKKEKALPLEKVVQKLKKSDHG